MLHQIITNTPRAVWILLAALICLGLSQVRARTVSWQRVSLLPLAMLTMSLYSSMSAFGSAPLALLSWLAACGLMSALMFARALPDGTVYERSTRQFNVPGSWLPFMLIMGIFVSKYVLGVLGSMQSAVLHESNFCLLFTTLSGAFSGVFLGRAASLWRLALQKNIPAGNLQFSGS